MDQKQYLSALNPALPSWLVEIKHFGIKNSVPIVQDQTGFLLKMLSQIHQPKNVLEVGSGVAYSMHYILWGCPTTCVLGLEQNAFRAEMCNQFLKQSGFAKQAAVKPVWAKDFFDANTQKFNFIFLDAMKLDYPKLLESCVNALAEGGLLVADNTLFSGRVVHLEPADEAKYLPSVKALQQFNQKVAVHPELQGHFLAIGDGVLVANKISCKS